MRFIVMMTAVTLSLSIACTTKEQKQEVLAQQYCKSCHSYPEPSLLSKDAWRTVMPQMAVRMGINISLLTRLPEADYVYVIQTLPKNPMISEQDFEAITSYYEREAPDSLNLPPDYEARELTQFDVKEMKLLGQRPTICMIKPDTATRSFWLSNRNLMMYRYGYDFKRLDSMKLTSPASSILFGNQKIAALMGIMDPNDQPAGSVVDVTTGQTMIDSIKRPVYIERGDFNNDKLEDIVVCAFGNYTGALSVYENANGNYIEHKISTLPGARKAIVKDFTNDGRPDILVMFSQGDENVSLYENAGNFDFRITRLLQFPPVYGSNYFDVVDFNKDGIWDIVTSNGDNADYSIIQKPYHGVRIFLNDGRNHFKESWFYPIYGSSMVLAKDFDKDGDIDLATTAFFPDFKKHPERGFIYFENNNGNLEPYVTPLAADARWLLMETADVDSDGYQDVILAALDFDTGVPADLNEKWKQNPVDIMVLKNKGKK